jgi:multidrug efflux pump subunit AcrA (membrane-fusion protein)
VVKEYATRQSVDTQEALVAQYQAAIAHDQAVIDNARVQLGYTTIVSPLAGRTGIRSRKQPVSRRAEIGANFRIGTSLLFLRISSCFRLMA